MDMVFYSTLNSATLWFNIIEITNFYRDFLIPNSGIYAWMRSKSSSHMWGLVVLIWNIKWMYILLNDCAIMFLCFCPFRALLFQYDSQGVASLALGYGQVALSGRCCGLKAQRMSIPCRWFGYCLLIQFPNHGCSDSAWLTTGLHCRPLHLLHAFCHLVPTVSTGEWH